MAREWFGVSTEKILDPRFRSLSARIIVSWLTLLAWCARDENRGVVPTGAADAPLWKSLGVGKRDVAALEAAGLVCPTDGGLRVVGYDVEREQEFQRKRVQGRSAANNRWKQGAGAAGNASGNPGGNANGSANGNATRNATGNATGTTEQIREAEKIPPSPPIGGNASGENDGFNTFWNSLPPWLQERKSQARQQWSALGLDLNPGIQAQMKQALAWQKKDQAWLERNKAQNLTAVAYLRKKRWEDESFHQTRRAPTAAPAPEPSREQSDAEFREQWEADPDNKGMPFPGRAAALSFVTRPSGAKEGEG
jgi:hypothetical protein